MTQKSQLSLHNKNHADGKSKGLPDFLGKKLVKVGFWGYIIGIVEYFALKSNINF